MKWVLRFVVALFFVFVFFGAIQHYLQLDRWMSVLLSVLLAVFTTLVATFDFVKKWYDARKGPYELRELQRKEKAAEQEKNSLIRSPSADELRRHGQSAVEQTLDQRFKTTGEDPLNPRRFVVDPEEKN